MKLKKLQTFLFIIFMGALLGSIDTSGRHDAKLIRVLDGDTVIVEIYGVKKRIRLAFIDAPEMSQLSYNQIKIGEISKQHLKALLIRDQNLEVQLLKKDIYKRWLGVLYINNRNINLQMVRDGMAMVYPRIDQGSRRNKAIFNGQELVSRTLQKGLWRETGFDYPWAYRRSLKN